MAPIRFEEQLKDKLEKRSLQPSADGWAKLSKRLDTEEKKSKSPWFWWMGIAAGIIILIAVAAQFFNSKVEEEITPQIVKENVIEQSEEPIHPNLNKVNPTELVIEDEQTENEVDHSTIDNPIENINKKSVINEKVKMQLASADDIENKKVEDSNEQNKELQSLIEEATINRNAVATAINEFKSENAAVTDREVDSLLKLASKELFKDKLKKETSKAVDASSLLLEVEEELGQSFRTKVYEALKESYETVKTAVAERNN